MITKTKFKEYSRCRRYFALEKLNEEGENAIVAAHDDEIRDILETIDGFDGSLDLTSAELEALLPYFNRLEKVSANVIEKHFEGEVFFSLETEKQKSFECIGNDYSYKCFVDCYLERKDSFSIFEVKATTTKKFVDLKYTENKEAFHIFEKVGNTYILKEELGEKISKKYLNQRRKLFDRYSSVGKYVYDLAIQRWIIENNYIQNQMESKLRNAKYYLAVLNSEYIFDGNLVNDKYPEINGQEIVTFIDLTNITNEYLNKIKSDVKSVEEYLDYREAPEIPVGQFCQRNKKDQCKYFDICWKFVPNRNSIFTYIDNHHGFTDQNDEKHYPLELINEGKVGMFDIPFNWLTREKNKIQYEVHSKDNVFIDESKVRSGLQALDFPIYHLDFESFPCPLPRFKGEKPYSQSVFQYSLHIQRTYNDTDIDENHYEFLAKDGNDNRYELVKSLIDNIGKFGPIIVWNESFELARIREFKEFFPEFENELTNIEKRIFDLMYVLKSNTKMYEAMGYSNERAKLMNYYHSDLQGSYSIKKVLPIFSDLNYDDMDVGNGMEAVVAYIMMTKLTGDEYYKKYSSLLEYCKQDTYAMLKILNEVKKMVD